MATHMPFDTYNNSVFQQYHAAAQLDYLSHEQFLDAQQQTDADLSAELLTGFNTVGRGPNDSPLSSTTHASDHSSSNGYPQAGPMGNSLHSGSSSNGNSPLFQTLPNGHPYPDLWEDANSAFPMSSMAPLGDGNLGLDVSVTAGLDFTGLLAGGKLADFVDPNLLDPISTPTSLNATPYQSNLSQSGHMLSPVSLFDSNQMIQQNGHNSDSQSPFYQHTMWPQQTALPHSPQPSLHSRLSQSSPRSSSMDYEDDGREKAKCPYPDCGKTFKDLKAHMLTHQNERPEKCPIVSCEFHKRGFARKYDRNRHLVTTHYKSTIVCGFCPGAGTPSEKTFNRTDVFKRHLVSVHGVEQTPPNSRKKSPVSSGRDSPSQSNESKGKCSTCGCFFANAQDLFEHLDDCVLRVVQQIEPSEANNERLLRSVAEDQNVKNTMERHLLAHNGDQTDVSNLDGDDNDDFEEAEDNSSESRAGRSGKGALKSFKDNNLSATSRAVTDGRISKAPANSLQTNRARGGLTYSQGGVAMQVGKSRKRRKHYPQSWGCAADKMKMKKRVLCVFDGQRRLWKDDMMLGNDFEVRMKLGDGEHYVTDLDVETMKRAEGFHMATPEERGPWVPTNYPGENNVNVNEFLG